jgi:transcriptional regulator with XRE-family HTH domain
MDKQGQLKHFSNSSSHCNAIKRLNSKKRSSRIFLTVEAKVLKKIREERKQKRLGKNYSLRAVAKRLGKTDSWLAQIENGRADFPWDERLDALLNDYGLKRKSFNERIRLNLKKILKSKIKQLFLLTNEKNVEKDLHYLTHLNGLMKFTIYLMKKKKA